MRPTIMRRAATSGIFSGLNERILIENVLVHPKRPHEYPFVAMRDAVVEQHKKRSPRIAQQKQLEMVLKPANAAFKSTKEAESLMHRPAITVPEIQHFLDSRYLDGVPQFERREKLHAGLLDLIAASTANNLRTLMQFLQLYWQVGVAGTRPSIYEARHEARALLERALECHPVTEFRGGGEQLGIPDFAKFSQFVNNFFTYMGVTPHGKDDLSALLLQLQARSGSLRAATTEVIACRAQVDDETLDVYLASLQRSRPDQETLKMLRPLLVGDDMGPRAVQFLLPMLSRDDLMRLLELIDQSCWRDEIYESCQVRIVEALLRAESSMAVIFGVLHRIKKRAPLRTETIDAVLAASPNDSAVQVLNKML